MNRPTLRQSATQTPFLICLLLASFPGTALGQHTGDVWVGVSGIGQLAISTNGFIPEDNYAALAPASGLIQGWTDDSPGFDRVVVETDIEPMSSGAEIWLEVIAVDPAFQGIDDGFQFLNDPGDDTYLGESNLHEHLTWHIDSQSPEFVESQCVWHATFVLRDDGSTGYATSEPFTFAFANVEARASGALADGDFDESGEIDAMDFAALAACLDGGGPGSVPQPNEPGVTTCEVECLNAFDFDDDRDVDLYDAATFQRALP